MTTNYMQQALDIAFSYISTARPNPAVGCVITYNGQVISTGAHELYGGDHAEVSAIKSAIDIPKGSDIYVTLEPCSHFGKTPPCTEALIKIQPANIYIGLRDPNKIIGPGIQALEEANIQVYLGHWAESCYQLNESYFYSIMNKKTLITLKWAASIDGKIYHDNLRAISSDEALEESHKLRLTHDAILVGAQTVITDNPRLTARGHFKKIKQPKIMVLDNKLRVLDYPLSHIFQGSPIIFTTNTPNSKQREQAKNLNAHIVTLKSLEGLVDLADLQLWLYKNNIKALLVEGGANTLNCFIKQNIFDRIIMFTAGHVIGAGIPINTNNIIQDTLVPISNKILGNTIMSTWFNKEYNKIYQSNIKCLAE